MAENSGTRRPQLFMEERVYHDWLYVPGALYPPGVVPAKRKIARRAAFQSREFDRVDWHGTADFSNFGPGDFPELSQRKQTGEFGPFISVRSNSLRPGFFR